MPRPRVEDVTGLHVTRDLGATLADGGIGLAAAGRQTEWEQWFARRGLERSETLRTFASLSGARAPVSRHRDRR